MISSIKSTSALFFGSLFKRVNIYRWFDDSWKESASRTISDSFVSEFSKYSKEKIRRKTFSMWFQFNESFTWENQKSDWKLLAACNFLLSINSRRLHWADVDQRNCLIWKQNLFVMNAILKISKLSNIKLSHFTGSPFVDAAVCEVFGKICSHWIQKCERVFHPN